MPYRRADPTAHPPHPTGAPSLPPATFMNSSLSKQRLSGPRGRFIFFASMTGSGSRLQPGCQAQEPPLPARHLRPPAARTGRAGACAMSGPGRALQRPLERSAPHCGRGGPPSTKWRPGEAAVWRGWCGRILPHSSCLVHTRDSCT